MLGAGAALSVANAQTKPDSKPIYLFVEMDVDPAREKEMLTFFHNEFVPEARKHQGYLGVRMLKLRQVFQGPTQVIPYRFEIVYESEELRQKWIKSPGHDRVWPSLEKMLKSTANYPVVLYDEV